MKRRRIKALWWMLSFAMAFVLISGIQILMYSGVNQTINADAAIVLGAAAWGKEPSPVLKERIHHAVKLYSEGNVNKIVFTGGRLAKGEAAESEVSRDYAISRGVRPEDIYIETESRITEQNFSFAKQIVLAKGLETVLVVSDPLHMKRAMTMAKVEGMRAYASPTQTSAYKSLKTQAPFFLREWFFYCGYLVLKPFR